MWCEDEERSIPLQVERKVKVNTQVKDQLLLLGVSRQLAIFRQLTYQIYLALINRTGGLYGRILTKVVSTDRTQWGLYTRPRSRFSHTDRLSSVNKMFIIWRKQEQFTLFNFACEGIWTEFNSSKVCSSSLFFFSHQLFGTYRNTYC